MLTVLALAMIVLFIVLLSAKKLSVFASLTLVPLVFGLIAIAVTNHGIMDLFAWIEKGIYFSADPDTGKVSWGVISPAMTILFSILYFDIMLGVGLFDPVAEFFIKKAKGDPLKVILSTVMVASVVAFNGDTTTTIIICISAFISLYRQMNLKLSYLAIVIVAPIGIWNMLPWGGPTIASATAQGKGISDESIQEMLKAVRDKDPELKRPKLFVFNLLLTLAALVLLIQGEIHGSIIFMLGSAIALVVNYRDVKLCSDRLEDLAPDVLPTAIITMGAGVFSGVLSGSGMANALANTIASLIPTSLSTHMAPVYAVIAAPAICFLPQDAFYFGIASVLKDVMGQFGITPLQSAVASMAGQSFRLVSPVIPALYMLCGETKMNFVDFQKEYTINFGWVVIIVYLVVFGLTGMLPY